MASHVAEYGVKIRRSWYQVASHARASQVRVLSWEQVIKLMINRKPCKCYLCRGKIQKGDKKDRVHGNNFKHKHCTRKPRRKSFLMWLLRKLNG